MTPPKGAAPAGQAKRERPLGQVGRRPPKPPLLLLMGIAWIAASVIAFVDLHVAWRLIPTIAFAGIGLLYLRAAGTAFLRQEGRR